MKKSWKRILAAVLAACMIFGDSSLVYATESTQQIVEASEIEAEEPQQPTEEVLPEEPQEDTVAEETQQPEDSEETNPEENVDVVSLNEESDENDVELELNKEYSTGINDSEGRYFSESYVFTPEKDGYYGFIGNISDVYISDADYDYQEVSYYKNGTTEVQKYYALYAGTTYYIGIETWVPSGEENVYQFVEDTEGDTSIALIPDGAAQEMTAGETKMFRVDVTGPSFVEFSATGEYVSSWYNAWYNWDTVAYFRDEGHYYVSVTANEDLEIELNTVETQALSLDQELDISKDKNICYEFETEENDSTVYYLKMENPAWIIGMDAEGNQEHDITEHTFYDADGARWICIGAESEVAKICILSYGADSAYIDSPKILITKNSSIANQLTSWSGMITVPANSTVNFQYTGDFYGDYFIQEPSGAEWGSDVHYRSIYYGAGIQGKYDVENLAGTNYVGFASYYDDESVASQAEAVFEIVNDTENELTFELKTNEDFETWVLTEGTTVELNENYKEEMDDGASYFSYYTFTPDTTKIYYISGCEWIYRTSDKKFFDQNSIVLKAGETYLLRFNQTSEITGTELTATSGTVTNFDFSTRTQLFTPTVSGDYYSELSRGFNVWDNEENCWSYVESGDKITLTADTSYVIRFNGDGRFGLKSNITVLDYDYYHALIQSGGSVAIVDGELKITEPENGTFSLRDVLLSLFGLDTYGQQPREDYIKANVEWVGETGAFAAAEYYKLSEDGTLQECSQSTVNDGDILVVKYEPEIVWVDSMTLAMDKSAIATGETANLIVTAKAATDKYPLRGTPQFVYESSNPSIISVDENGVLTAHKVGTATITVAADVAKRYEENCPEKIVKKTIKITVGRKYDINYMNVGGAEGSLNENNPTEYRPAEKTMLTEPTANAGYEFVGWYSDAKLTKKITNIAKGSSGDKKVYAKWKLKDYNINYALNGGKFDGTYPATFTVAEDKALVAPIRHGYNFEGWYTSAGFEGEEVRAIAKGRTEDITLYAKWAWEADFSLKVNGDNGTYTFPYNTAKDSWTSVPISLFIESTPKGIIIDEDFYDTTDGDEYNSLELELYKSKDNSLVATIQNTLELDASYFEEPGEYYVKGTYRHPNQEPQTLEAVPIVINYGKREYPVDKEIEWSALSTVEGTKTFGDIKSELAELMQPTEDSDAFESKYGEGRLEPVKITIRNAKKSIVKDTAKVTSGTYTVTLQFAENERFFNEATATLKLSYGAITNAGVEYTAISGGTEDASGRTAGATIAYPVPTEDGSDAINTTPYTTGVVITPMLKTPWNVISADELETVLNENGYSGYTVEVSAKEAISKSKPALLNIVATDGAANVTVTANGTAAGKRNITVTTTIKNAQGEVVATINSTVKNFTVVNGGVDAVSSIVLDLFQVKKNESGEEIKTQVATYGETSADGVKTYLIEKESAARNYRVDWTAYNYENSGFDAKLTWKSSNSKLASVKVAKDGTVTLTVPKNAQGVVDITATAKDAGKKSQSMKLVIVDTSMRLDTTSLTLNSLKAEETAIAYLYPNVLAADLGLEENETLEGLFENATVGIYKKVKDGKVYKYELDSEFKADYDVEAGKLEVSFARAQAKAKTHTVYVGITHDLTNETEYHTLKIKDTCALPKKPALKVTKSYETVYTDGYAELQLTTYGEVDYVETASGEQVPDIQTTDNQKFEVFGWEDINGDGTVWKLKVREKEGYENSVLPTGKQSSKTTKGVKFEIGYAEYLTKHTATANITATKALPKLSVYGEDAYAPVYYTDADVRYVDVVIPVTEGMMAGCITDNKDSESLTIDDENKSSAYLGDNADSYKLKVTLKDASKFEIISAKCYDKFGDVPAKKNYTYVDHAILLTVKVKDSQMKNVSLQFDVESANLVDGKKITTGKLTIKPRKVASDSFTLVNNANTVKSLTFNGALAGKESITLTAKLPTNLATVSEENVIKTRILVEGADKNGKKMLQNNALLLDVNEEGGYFTITSTDNSFKYSSCKLKVTMQVIGEDRVVNTKSTTLSLSFKKSLTPKITLTNTKLYRGLEKSFVEETRYMTSRAIVKAKISNMPVGAEIVGVRFADPADASKYYAPEEWENNGTFYLRPREEAALPLGKDKLDLIYDIRTASGDKISVNASVTVTIADNISMKADVKSINLYNSAVGKNYGKDVTFYDAKGHAVKVIDIVNAEELKKAGINFEIDTTSSEEEMGHNTVSFYVDKNLKRGTEKTYTVKAKVALVNSAIYDVESGTWPTQTTATEKTVTFKIVLKK